MKKKESPIRAIQFGETDHLIVTGEPFALWVIVIKEAASKYVSTAKVRIPIVLTLSCLTVLKQLLFLLFYLIPPLN